MRVLLLSKYGGRDLGVPGILARAYVKADKDGITLHQRLLTEPIVTDEIGLIDACITGTALDQGMNLSAGNMERSCTRVAFLTGQFSEKSCSW